VLQVEPAYRCDGDTGVFDCLIVGAGWVAPPQLVGDEADNGVDVGHSAYGILP
jgi:hypothetical protein